MSEGKWIVPVSNTAKNTFNPIRDVVDIMEIEPNPDMKVIKLTTGDPAVYGNLPPCEKSVDAFCSAIRSGKANGYTPAHGALAAREAVARYCSTPKITVSPEDVILASGCSGAIELALDVLVDEGDNILIPCPGFSLYRCLCGSKGIETRSYRLIPEKSWEADLKHMASQIDDRTKAIIVINPSNPCGSVYTKEHLEDILAVAGSYHVPIISDEVYAFVTFSERPFYSLGSMAKTVPVLTVGGIAKRFLAPGWRLGWVVIHDRSQTFDEELRNGLRRLAQRILGPCSALQAALPTILSECSPQFFEKTTTHIKNVAEIFYETLLGIPELYPVKPYGAMYMLVGVKVEKLRDVEDDVEFTQRLMSEQSVFVLPAQCFEYRNFVRLVLLCPEDTAREACLRIARFCANHRKDSAVNDINGLKNSERPYCTGKSSDLLICSV